MAKWLFMVSGLLSIALSALSAEHPLAVSVIFLLAAVSFTAARWPYQTASMVGFMAAAFPKAGIKIAGFPIPFFLLALLIALILLSRSALDVQKLPAEVSMVLVGLLGWISVRGLLIKQFAGWESVFTYLAWTAVPTCFLCLAIRLQLPDLRWRYAVERGYLVASLFAVVQLVGGIEETAVPGLTIALGDSYAAKNNAIFEAGGATASKIMSTYQNGNIFAVVSAIFATVAVMRLARRCAARHDIVLLVAATSSVVLSGSRTGVVALLVGLVLTFARSGSIVRKGAIVGAAVGLYNLVLVFQPALSGRYSIDSGISNGGAGRATMWLEAFRQNDLQDWILGSTYARLQEGGVGLLQQHGLLGLGLTVMLVTILTRRRPEWRIPMLCLATAAFIDSSYVLFPTWFLPAVLTACPITASRNGSSSSSQIRDFQGVQLTRQAIPPLA